MPPTAVSFNNGNHLTGYDIDRYNFGMNRVDRLFGYLLLFQSRGKTLRAQDFAARFEISERTVYRDIQALCEVGVPIIATPGEGYQLMDGYYLPPISFSAEEARALFLAVSMLDGFTEAGDTKTAVSHALEKIRAVLPDHTRREAEALQAIIRFYAFPAPPINFDDRLFLQLQQAIHEKRVARIQYHAQHSNKITTRDIEPSEFALLDKSWMVTAYCRLRQDSRVFRLDRIDQCSLLNEYFSPQDLGDHSQTFGESVVRLRVQASSQRWIREQQHFSFVGEETTEGSRDVVMCYKPKTFEQMMPWILGWGTAVEVLQPVELRLHLRDVTQQMNDFYQ